MGVSWQFAVLDVSIPESLDYVGRGDKDKGSCVSRLGYVRYIV